MNYRIYSTICLTAGSLAISLAATGCDGKFVGPLEGSAFLHDGRNTFIGATPFTFTPENTNLTGFAVDYWFMNPGLDSNYDTIGDFVDCLKEAEFDQFTFGANAAQIAPKGTWEGNLAYPMVVSFMNQWFRRLADGSRPRDYDFFGRLDWSAATHDISILTGPFEGDTVSDFYPAGGSLPLSGYRRPDRTDPGGGFPAPQEPYGGKMYNELAILRFAAIAVGSNPAGLSLGAPITDNRQNQHVESMSAIPFRDPQTGQVVSPIGMPVGVYADKYALAYSSAPVKHPNMRDEQGNLLVQDLCDNNFVAVLVEFCRHLAAVHANIVGQSIGLAANKPQSIMDPGMAVIENGFQYAFHLDDHADMSNLQVVPDEELDFNDPRFGIGLLPGWHRRP